MHMVVHLKVKFIPSAMNACYSSVLVSLLFWRKWDVTCCNVPEFSIEFLVHDSSQMLFYYILHFSIRATETSLSILLSLILKI